MKIAKLAVVRPQWIANSPEYKSIENLLVSECAARCLSLKPVIGGVQMYVSSGATSRGRATVFIPEESFPKVVIIAEHFNSRNPATIEGESVAWSYSSGHGMTLGAVIKLPSEGETSDFSIWVPGHHGHGPGTLTKYKMDMFANVTSEDAPTANRLKL